MIFKVILTLSALTLARDGGMTRLLYAYIFSQLITTPMSFYLVRRLIGVSLMEVWRGVWPMLAGCLALFAVAMAGQKALQELVLPAIVVLVASAVAGGLTYVGFLHLVAPRVLRDTLHMIHPLQAAVVTPPGAADVMRK
jgi:hypothetical protein